MYEYSKVFKGYITIRTMANKEIKVYECQCERCKHIWITRSEELPVVCPNCKSPYWNKPRQEGKGKKK